jgi:hypothetical protein
MFPTLEKYHGTKSRHTCPSCNSKGAFVRYVGESGEYISDDCGRCNRESKCGYHYTPKQYFADNPQIQSEYKKGKSKGKSIDRYSFVNKNGLRVNYEARIVQKKPDFIPFERLKATLNNYDRNAFVQFLLNLFPDCGEEIQNVLKHYFVGTYQDGLTVFWQIDGRGRIRTGKIMRYDPATGKRGIVRSWMQDGEKRELKTDWMHGKIKKDFNLNQCFFGEHLLPKYPNKSVAIVEAEKTAIIASLCFPEFIWLSCGGKKNLKADDLKKLAGRRIILYPDADDFELWQSIAREAQRQGLNVKASSLIENFATDEQKADGYDLADYLINQQKEINELNEVYDAYNSKLETVLNDESLKQDFNLILDEQKAIAIYNGSTEQEAERICTRPENLRRIILNNY